MLAASSPPPVRQGLPSGRSQNINGRMGARAHSGRKKSGKPLFAPVSLPSTTLSLTRFLSVSPIQSMIMLWILQRSLNAASRSASWTACGRWQLSRGETAETRTCWSAMGSKWKRPGSEPGRRQGRLRPGRQQPLERVSSCSSRSAPPGRRSIVFMDSTVAGAIGPVPVRIAVELRRSLKLIFSYADPVSAKSGIVLEACPGHRVVVLPHPEEASKRHDCLSNLAADLVDHYPLDGSDLIVIPAVNRRSLDFVAAD